MVLLYNAMNTEPTSAGEIPLFESLITGLLDKGLGYCDEFLEEETVNGLRSILLNHHSKGEMKPAGVGKNFDFQRNAAIRGDVIRWLDPRAANKYEQAFLSKVDRFTDYLNATCYAGINDHEFHYAYYEAGSFYKRHLDRFKNDKGRQFSFVLYLNDHWKTEDQGMLSLYLEEDVVSLSPIGGRVVFFRSDQTEHEVKASLGRPRLSIAGWLKRL